MQFAKSCAWSGSHLLLAQFVQQGLDHAQRLVIGGAAAPDLGEAQLPEELVHRHQHHRALDLLHANQRSVTSSTSAQGYMLVCTGAVMF
jgi:hypothetical protein